ncbi:DUF6145 family protein [Butyrivibrio sp. INlla16]|uniref:DUF6145 family protein n=1 Tax=Butyrivibrio sp. INlla16 TaxID=1520807 RepID=UPI0008914353|nr:DUF6145 family protein [Butyrivibrio sp. INlla16]SDB14264.1 hypothetical protein SAMN02910263_00668 [Butyrivibrio sp. INlla16]
MDNKKETRNIYNDEARPGDEEKLHSDTLNADKAKGRRLIINKETGKITNAETGEEVSDIQVVTEDGSLGSVSAGGRIILCGANAYEMKYYFNPLFKKIPESIQKELHIISVLFTQEAGGIFTIEFEDDGMITMETTRSEEDITYDEVSAGLLIGEVRRQRQDLFEALQMYYRAMILHEDMSDILSEEE